MRIKKFAKKIYHYIKVCVKSFFHKSHTFDVYFGVPGSGKSTFGAWLVKRIIKKGGTVWSNVPISGAYKVDVNEDIGKHLISNGHLIIDEAGIEYNNRKFKTFSDEATYFYKFHRHYKVSVYLFSQGYDDMDKKLRTLATRLYVVKKSLLPFLVKRSLIAKRVGINELTKEICDEYYKVPFSTRYIFAPAVWHMFNSYSVKALPKKEWEKW